MKHVSLGRFLAYIKCWGHCLLHSHKSCYHGRGFSFGKKIVWTFIDIVWCYDCGKVFYNKEKESPFNKLLKDY